MNFENHHPLQAYWDLTVAAVQAEAFDLALESGLLDHLQMSGGVADIARHMHMDPHRSGLLLELLWSMGVLERSTGDSATSYRLTPALAPYLVSNGGQYCGDAWRYRLQALRHFGTQLRGLLQAPSATDDSGQPGSVPATKTFQSANGPNWAQAARKQIGQEQRAATTAAALHIVSAIAECQSAFAATGATPAKPLHMLDLGGGPGWVAIALAQACPPLTGAVFDWPETVAVAADNIRQTGLAQRLHALPGNLEQDDIGHGYDLIWCSSVLHFVPDMAAVLAKILAALKPGGVLVCAQAEIAGDAAAAARVLPYYLPMRMLGRHVTYQGQLAQLLADNGFVAIEQSTSTAFPMAPVQVLIARKDAA
ncbi:class I SAM-dependent methyltransferase [Herbaspirillum autotrophicum]|uniref:class I SAM-dependent methyltransferase n=1 Tax=Herbaspirillum autotrophicum TaxID=180195 RepID=UPI00067CBF56|nr:class I SAM-dependent methyltransferase [Herbaspirillum autotrophicum]